MKIRNRRTGNILEFSWDQPTPPTDADIDRIERDSRTPNLPPVDDLFAPPRPGELENLYAKPRQQESIVPGLGDLIEEEPRYNAAIDIPYESRMPPVEPLQPREQQETSRTLSKADSIGPVSAMDRVRNLFNPSTAWDEAKDLADKIANVAPLETPIKRAAEYMYPVDNPRYDEMQGYAETGEKIADAIVPGYKGLTNMSLLDVAAIGTGIGGASKFNNIINAADAAAGMVQTGEGVEEGNLVGAGMGLFRAGANVYGMRGAEQPKKPLKEELFEDVSDYYSGLERAINTPKMPKSATGEQWSNILRQTPGVRRDEMDYRGVGEFLSSKPGEKISREDLFKHLDENRVEIEEIDLSESYNSHSRQRTRYGPKDYGGEKLIEDGPYDEYKEILIKRPRRTDTSIQRQRDEILNSSRLKELTTKSTDGTATDKELAEMEALERQDWELSKKQGEVGSYKSPHFNDEGDNLLAHVRATGRRNSKGEKVWHIEEYQSDLAHAYDDAGRKFKEDLDPLRKEASEINKKLEEYQFDPKDPYKTSSEVYKLQNRLDEISDILAEADSDAPPSTPFIKGSKWVNLLTKRMIEYAAQNGYDRISWTTGEHQARRYGKLKEYTDAYISYKDGGLEGENRKPTLSDHITLLSERVGSPKQFSIEEATNLLGKDVVDKIIANGAVRLQQPIKESPSWMTHLYDEHIPNVMKEEAKRAGFRVEVEDTDIGTSSRPGSEYLKNEVVNLNTRLQMVKSQRDALEDTFQGRKVSDLLPAERTKAIEFLNEEIRLQTEIDSINQDLSNMNAGNTPYHSINISAIKNTTPEFPLFHQIGSTRKIIVQGKEITSDELTTLYRQALDAPHPASIIDGKYVVTNPEGDFPNALIPNVVQQFAPVAHALDNVVQTIAAHLGLEGATFNGFAMSYRVRGLNLVNLENGTSRIMHNPLTIVGEQLYETIKESVTNPGVWQTFPHKVTRSLLKTTLHEMVHHDGYRHDTPEQVAIFKQKMTEMYNAVDPIFSEIRQTVRQSLEGGVLDNLIRMWDDVEPIYTEQRRISVNDGGGSPAPGGDRQGRTSSNERVGRRARIGLDENIPDGSSKEAAGVGGGAKRSIGEQFYQPRTLQELDRGYRGLVEKTEMDLGSGRIDTKEYSKRMRGLKLIRGERAKLFSDEIDPGQLAVNPQAVVQAGGKVMPATAQTIQAASSTPSGGGLPPVSPLAGGGGTGGGKPPIPPSKTPSGPTPNPQGTIGPTPQLPKDPTPFTQHLLAIANLPRAIQSSFDMSMPLRQALVLTAGRPIKAAKATGAAMKAMFNEAFADRTINEIMTRPNAGLYQESGLSLTAYKSGQNLPFEESFISRFSQAIPGIKHSNRAAVVFLDKMRADVFDSIVDGWKKSGQQLDPKKVSALAEYINNATGRGKLPFGLERNVPLMNTILYSPKFQMSRVRLLVMAGEMLNPITYKNIPWEVRKEALRDMAATVGAGTALLGLAAMNGADVETDPRSSDFAKIKIGNTRIDPWGGYQQYVRFAAQQATGEYIPTTGKNKGNVREYDKTGSMFKTSRADAIGTFGRSRLSPTASLGWDYLSGKDVIGRKFDVKAPDFVTEGRLPDVSRLGEDVSMGRSIDERVLPLVWQDVYKMMEEDPSFAALAVPAFFGMGLQTYDSSRAK